MNKVGRSMILFQMLAGFLLLLAPTAHAREVIERIDQAEVPAGQQGSSVEWESIGPYGGSVEVVAASPNSTNVVLAGTKPEEIPRGNLYRSINSGSSWEQVLGDLQIFDITFAPGGVVYAATSDSVWKSVNDGISWEQLNLGIGVNDGVLALRVDPNIPTTVWAGIGSALGNQSVNIMRSEDAGLNWVDMTPPLAAPITGSAIAINPLNSLEIYAGFAGDFGGSGEVWVSTNGGLSWTNRSAGLPNRAVNDIEHDGTRVLVGGGVAFLSQFLGVYESTNQGVTWNALHDASWTLPAVTDIEVDPNNIDNVFVTTEGTGLHRSTDGGQNWELSVNGTDSKNLHSVRISPSSSSDLFVGATGFGVLASTDGGANFEESSVGINEVDTWSVAVAPDNSAEIATSFRDNNDGGVYTSLDNGVTWQLEPLNSGRWSIVSYATDGTLYAVRTLPGDVSDVGVHRKEANGSWTLLGPDSQPDYFSQWHAFHISQADPNVFFLGGRESPQSDGQHGKTIWRSPDAGQTWTKVHKSGEFEDHVTDFEVVDDGTGLTILASFSDRADNPVLGGVIRSADGGLTWSLSSSGIAPEARGLALCGSSTDNSTFFYAMERIDASLLTLYTSTDIGQTWSPTGSEVGAIYDVVCHPEIGDLLYIAGFDGLLEAIVLISHNGGANFSTFASGLGFGFTWRARSLFITNEATRRLFLASSRGVFRRPDWVLGFQHGFE